MATILILNSKGVPYPEIYVEGYGRVPFPEGPFTPNNTGTRSTEFTNAFKNEFKTWWISQGRTWPSGSVNIHHIKPLAHGGTNIFFKFSSTCTTDTAPAINKLVEKCS